MQIEAPTPVRLYDLSFSSCRWPVSPSWSDRTEFFCGEPTALGCSWCEAHRRRVFVPVRRKGSDTTMRGT
jgi:hypothetical protein